MSHDNYKTDTLGSPIGHPQCRQCRDKPSHRVEECGHTTCEMHANHEQDYPTCGHCGNPAYDLVKLPIASPLAGINDTTRKASPHTPHTPSPLHKMQNINSGSTNGGGLGSGIDAGMGANNFNMPKTPAPGARYGAINHGGSNNGGIANQGLPYVPPQLRGDPIPRPDSRASTATFASQAPIQQESFTSPNGSRSDPFVTPEGHYRLGLNALPRHISQLSLSGNEQHSPQPRFPFKNNNNTMRPPPMSSGMFDNSSRGIHLQPGTEAHATRAAALADMIKAGGTDDPRDPDYGNPGPSRRPAPVTKSPVVKLKRGDVVAGAGQGNKTSPRQFSKEEPNIDGNAVAFLNPIKLPLPSIFEKLAQGSFPTFEEFMRVIPIVEACSFARPSTAGVIHIANIPYTTSRSEIVALLGSQAKIVAQPPGSPFHAVHIVMDRQSGKTMDAFVEVETGKEARFIVGQFAGRAARNRHAKLGDRTAEINLSNRDEMLATLFPRAKNVTWVNGVPKIDERVEYFYPGRPSTGFNGFLQDEEITHMAKHAETPQRSPFANRCLIRTYECIITTLYKYPWFATEHVLEVERVRLFECVKASVRALINSLSKTRGDPRADSTKPTTTTLKELTVAVLICPGFAEKEKAQIVADLKGSGYHQLTRPHDLNVRFGGNHTFAEDWPFKIAAKHPGASDQIMEFFAQIMRDATRGAGASIADLYAAHAGAISSNFGAVNIDYSGAKTYADAYRIEVQVVSNLVGRVLNHDGSATSSPPTGTHNS